MTKKQCKEKVERLKERRSLIDEQIVHFERQTRLLDAEDSKRLLEKYHIESEELAQLIFRQKQENQRRMTAERARKAEKEEIRTEMPVKAIPNEESPVNPLEMFN